MSGRFQRLAETGRPDVTIRVDGRPVSALKGDTVMVAMLNSGFSLRSAEFGPEKRAGFCLMGACQDCWVWKPDGSRLRACSTQVESDLEIRTSQPEATWPHRG
jgi:D-hydroxyproline dehydrogenase subunit gamma